MQFNSLKYIVYLLVVIVVYYCIPSKTLRLRNLWLLCVSYFFYLSWNATYFLLILTSTIITYIGGLIIGEHKKNNSPYWRKIALVTCLLGNLGILFFFKYYNFLGDILAEVLQAFNLSANIPLFDILLPVGISFYTFQALGYVIDVYAGRIKPTCDFGKYALFVSFFPQLVAGPIERSGNLLPQFDVPHKFSYENLKQGLPLIVWGLFKKMVIADRVAIAVNSVYNNVSAYSGWALIVATLLFAIQIYCDFSAYSDIAIGSARMLGFKLMLNFRSPYFADSIRDFWGRWHISLSTWFRDYLYIPLGGNRCNLLKRSLNILVVFIVSGLWHGAGWTFIAWGALHGVYQLLERLLGSLLSRLGIKERRGKLWKGVKILVTFCLVSFAWIFFRANNLSDAFYIIQAMVVPANALATAGLGLELSEWIVAGVAMFLLFLVDINVFKGGPFSGFHKQNILVRWFVLYVLIFGTIVFGMYGIAYEAQPFIYFRF